MSWLDYELPNDEFVLLYTLHTCSLTMVNMAWIDWVAYNDAMRMLLRIPSSIWVLVKCLQISECLHVKQFVET